MKAGIIDGSIPDTRYSSTSLVPAGIGTVAGDDTILLVLRALARKKLQLIVSIGFSQTQPVQKIAAEYPNVHFVIIDGNAQGKNVNSVLFKEEEGSYLVGVAAAMASTTVCGTWVPAAPSR